MAARIVGAGVSHIAKSSQTFDKDLKQSIKSGGLFEGKKINWMKLGFKNLVKCLKKGNRQAVRDAFAKVIDTGLERRAVTNIGRGSQREIDMGKITKDLLTHKKNLGSQNFKALMHKFGVLSEARHHDVLSDASGEAMGEIMGDKSTARAATDKQFIEVTTDEAGVNHLQLNTDEGTVHNSTLVLRNFERGIEMFNVSTLERMSGLDPALMEKLLDHAEGNPEFKANLNSAIWLEELTNFTKTAATEGIEDIARNHGLTGDELEAAPKDLIEGFLGPFQKEEAGGRHGYTAVDLFDKMKLDEMAVAENYPTFLKAVDQLAEEIS